MSERVHGAGILPYDELGIYVMLEEHRGKRWYTDAGGRRQDGEPHLSYTAIREFNEETYYRFHLMSTLATSLSSYQVGVTTNRGYYRAHVVPVSVLMDYVAAVPGQSPPLINQPCQWFKKERQEAKRQWSKGYFPTLGMHYLTYEQLAQASLIYPLSPRLTSILNEWKNPTS